MESSINKLDYGKPHKHVKQEENMVTMAMVGEQIDHHRHLNHGDDEQDQKVKKTGGGARDGGGVSEGGKMVSVAPAAGIKSCQAENCGANLMEAKQYHRRHKVCEYHAKAQFALVAGFRQRFCQQCSRFHELAEFDDTKRSCRRRLAGHNERRRKTSADSPTGGSSSRKEPDTHLKEVACGQQADESSSGRIQISIEDNTSYKHFQIR